MLDFVDANGDMVQQSNTDGTKAKTVLLDVRTRWNSTFTMLRRIVNMQSEMATFLLWYHDPLTQRTEFRGNRTKLPVVSEREWAVVTGICYILQPFGVATEELGGQKTPTVASVVPVVKFLSKQLINPDMFTKAPGKRRGQNPYKWLLYENYKECDFFISVIDQLNKCREYMSRSFNKRFKGTLLPVENGQCSLEWMLLLNPFQYSDFQEVCDKERYSVEQDFKKHVEQFAYSDPVLYCCTYLAVWRHRCKMNISQVVLLAVPLLLCIHAEAG